VSREGGTMNTRVRFLILLFVAVILLCGRVQAQSTFGSMRGMTLDQTGGGVPQARVVLHSVDENADSTTTSDDQGNFAFENIKPGKYTLTASKDGFSNGVVNGVELAARQDLRLDVKLAVASVQQVVEVSAAAVTVNTENATLTDSKLNNEITGLPLNSRAVSSSPLAALALSPDVVKDSQGNISVGGATASQTGFSVDGISTASVRMNGALQDAYPSQEGISEMKVTAFNNNAEFAQMGDVTFTTKSGTEQFHGSLFEYFQNDALDSTVYGFSSKAPKNFNTFGGSLGGPVIVPKLWDGKRRRHFSSPTTRETARPRPRRNFFSFPLRRREKAI
jgi:carboxypeptidase family protein